VRFRMGGFLRMSQSEDSFISNFQKLYEYEYGRAVSKQEAKIILNALGNLLLLADDVESEDLPP